MTIEMSRTQKAIRNAKSGVFGQILNAILAFISRTIFINLMSVDYLGVNGLFLNILTILSFTELGIGNAFIFHLYKTLAEKNINKIQALMNLYAKTYKTLGCLIAIMGLLLIPFMSLIIKDAPDIKEDLTIVYLLYLTNTVVTYLFSHKKSLIIADQKDYIVQIYNRLFQIIQIIGQSVLLVIFREYLLYLIFQVICTIVSNVFFMNKANMLFPYIKEKSNIKLSHEEKKSLVQNAKSLFTYKLGSVVLNGTDNIIISAILNVSAIGVSSNYTMLINNVSNIIGQGLNSITANIGNLCVNGSKHQIKSVMNQLLMLCIWFYGFISIGFLTLSNEFIVLWLGEEYLLKQDVVLALVFSLYINGAQYAAYTFRINQGLFVQCRSIPLISAAINVVLSIIWGKWFGLAGVFFATGISRFVTTTIVDPWLVYKYSFGIKSFEYYKKYFLESLIVIVNAYIHIKIISSMQISSWIGFFIKLTVICITCNLVFLIAFGWTKDFKELLLRLMQLRVKRRLHQ